MKDKASENKKAQDCSFSCNFIRKKNFLNILFVSDFDKMFNLILFKSVLVDLTLTLPWPFPDFDLTFAWPCPDLALTVPWPSLTLPLPCPDLSLTLPCLRLDVHQTLSLLCELWWVCRVNLNLGYVMLSCVFCLREIVWQSQTWTLYTGAWFSYNSQFFWRISNFFRGLTLGATDKWFISPVVSIHLVFKHVSIFDLAISVPEKWTI